MALKNKFILCPKFAALRETYSQRLKMAASTMLDAYKVPEEDIAFITEQVSNLFSDSDVWPEEQLSIWAY